jgi:2'-hydroxyisoflavone reductase
MRILIIGGTRFVGRHITEAAIAAGHDVTLLHRGQTGADLFPDAEHIQADRNEDLGVLGGRSWDATIDVTAYWPRQVEALAGALDGNGGQYVFISSVSAYATPPAPNYTESAALVRLPADAPFPEEMSAEVYGPLKTLCEEAAVEAFGAGTLIIRPTYVVGPEDHTGRFTYWVQRIARGGDVLAPGPQDAPIQFIDARDQAAFIAKLVGEKRAGVFHTVAPHLTFQQMLERIAAVVAPEGTRLVWADAVFLAEAGIDARRLPLWHGDDEADLRLNTADPAAAVAAGLDVRTLEDTVRDLGAEPEVTTFLGAADEADILARWAERDGAR